MRIAHHFGDPELLERLIAKAAEISDGHVSILKFTSNWRVAFGTVEWREDFEQMAVGKTFAEAATKALAALTRI